MLAVLVDQPGFLSAQDVHALLRAAGGRTGLTSVYRALGLLAQDGAVDVRLTPSGESTYRRCASSEHHHHLSCTSCGGTVELSAPMVEGWLGEVATEHGFVLDRHVIDLTGLCADCARAAARGVGGAAGSGGGAGGGAGSRDLPAGRGNGRF